MLTENRIHALAIVGMFLINAHVGVNSPNAYYLRHIPRVRFQDLVEEMVSGRFIVMCTTGMVGSLFLGYCVYFDKKRRRDPEYKKKVLASEQAFCPSTVWGLCSECVQLFYPCVSVM